MNSDLHNTWNSYKRRLIYPTLGKVLKKSHFLNLTRPTILTILESSQFWILRGGTWNYSRLVVLYKISVYCYWRFVQLRENKKGGYILLQLIDPTHCDPSLCTTKCPLDTFWSHHHLYNNSIWTAIFMSFSLIRKLLGYPQFLSPKVRIPNVRLPGRLQRAGQGFTRK